MGMSYLWNNQKEEKEMNTHHFEYTLDEIEKYGFSELQQVFLLGCTLREMRKKKPNGKVTTWMSLEYIAEMFVQ